MFTFRKVFFSLEKLKKMEFFDVIYKLLVLTPSLTTKKKRFHSYRPGKKERKKKLNKFNRIKCGKLNIWFRLN